MAAELLETSPVFATRMAECAAAVDRHTDWSLLDVLRGVPGAASLDRVDVVQPALFAMMVSLAALWRSHGVEPAAVVGHSQGEIAAAAVAGALSLEDAALVVTLRSQAIAVDLAGRGGMVSVSAPIAEVAKRLPDGVSVAAVNGPSTVVVSGDNDGLDRLLAECERDGVRARRIDVDYASHSAHVESMRDELLRVLAPIKPRTSEIPFYSTVVGEPIDTAELTAEYWYRNLRQTVEFEDTVRGLVAAGVDSFVEVSPHPVLVPAVGDLLADGGSAVGTLRRDDGGVRRFLLSLAQAHTRGVQPDFSTLVTGRPVALPTYAFQHQAYWPKEVGAPADAAGLGLGSTGHPLLGATVALAGADGVLLTGRLSVSAHPWLADHRVAGRIFLPGTAFVELAVRAGDEVGATAVEELTLEAPLIVPEKGSVQVQLRVGEPDAAGVRRLTVHSRLDDDSAWVRHATGTLVGLRGDTGDLQLLHEVRETDFDTACGLGGMPEPSASADALREWAQELDDTFFGTDPADESLHTWTDLARDQGMTELARVALIRELDEIVMDQSRLRRPEAPQSVTTAPLSALARDFEELGDHTQALRAQRLYTALQETAWDRVSARLDQARLERTAAQLLGAAGTLAALRGILEAPADDSLRDWQRVNLGRFIAEEHYTLARALAEDGLPVEARALLAAADGVLGELSEFPAKGVRELAEETAARVREVS
jgi:acyl transferase domain-containing protein